MTWSPGPNGMDIETLADADVAEARREQPLGRFEIGHRGDLQVILAAGDDQRRDAGRLGDRGVIGHHPAHGGAVRRHDRCEVKPLRGLRPP